MPARPCPAVLPLQRRFLRCRGLRRRCPLRALLVQASWLIWLGRSAAGAELRTWAQALAARREAAAALARVCAIWERFPQLSEGLADYYLQLMALNLKLGRTEEAEIWQSKAKVAAEDRAEKPRR